MNGKDSFDPNSPPTQVFYQRATFVEVPETGEKVKLNIWDTLGQEKHRSMTRNYYLKADAAIVMYDVTQRDTFEEVDYWLKDIKANLGPD